MQKWYLALVVGFASAPVWADVYTIDSRHTHPSYEISHLGWSIQRGRFDNVTGSISLDRGTKTGSVEVSIDAASISTGVSKLDEHLRSADFFNVAKYPTITFKATKMIFKDDTLSAVHGDISILGVTRPATLTVTHFACGVNPMLKKDVCGAEASAYIKRSEFGMTKFLPGLGDDVKLLINVEAIKD